MSLGKKIKKLREEKGIRQEDIGKLFNVSKSAVSQWENDIRTPDMDTIVKLAAFFNVTTDYLLGHTVKEAALEYGVKEVRFPQLHEDYPDVNIDQYIADIREAVGKAVVDGKIKHEEVDNLVKQMTRFLLFEIEELNKKYEK